MKTNSIFVFGFFLSALFSCNSESKQEVKTTPEQETMKHYLYQKSLISDTFCRMVYKLPVDCRGLDVEQQLLYFIFKKEVGKNNVLQALVLDTTKVEFAPCDTGPCVFGGLQGDITGHYAFKMPVSNLKVPKELSLPCLLVKEKYTVSLSDLIQDMDSSITYHTESHFHLTSDFLPYRFATNIASFISKKDRDPIITKLAVKLTQGLKTKEEKIQAVLNFVTNEISYSFEDYWYQNEITKRAHEVLISGLGDCSAKSTLMASMLEALNIPYALLYFDKHVNVGVMGNFSEENKLSVLIGKDRYFFAETTAIDFQIGKSHLLDAENLSKVYYYQKPQKDKFLYLYSNNAPLLFATEEEMEEALLAE